MQPEPDPRDGVCKIILRPNQLAETAALHARGPKLPYCTIYRVHSSYTFYQLQYIFDQDRPEKMCSVSERGFSFIYFLTCSLLLRLSVYRRQKRDRPTGRRPGSVGQLVRSRSRDTGRAQTVLSPPDRVACARGSCPSPFSSSSAAGRTQR